MMKSVSHLAGRLRSGLRWMQGGAGKSGGDAGVAVTTDAEMKWLDQEGGELCQVLMEQDQPGWVR